MDTSTGRLVIDPPDENGNIKVPDHLIEAAKKVEAMGLPMYSDKHEFTELREWALEACRQYPGKKTGSLDDEIDRFNAHENKKSFKHLRQSGKQPITREQMREKRRLQKARKQAKKRNRS